MHASQDVCTSFYLSLDHLDSWYVVETTLQPSAGGMCLMAKNRMLNSDAMRSISLRAWALVLASALLQLLPFPLAGPVPAWRRYFCWFCLTPLLLVLLDKKRGPTVLQAALLGYVCGFFWYLGNCYWIYQTMHVYGQISKPGALGILVLFSLYLGLYQCLFAALTRFLALRLRSTSVLVLVPVLWVAVELARARITGFPWDLLGYAQIDSSMLTKLAPLTGVMGMSFVIALVNVLWLNLANASRRWMRPVCALLVIVVASVSARTPSFAPNATAILLQENLSVGGEAKRQSESREQMVSAFQQLSLRPTTTATPFAQQPRIIIWPEAPSDFFDADATFRNSLGAVAKQSNSPVIADSIGVAPKDAQGQMHFYNTASFFAANGEHVGSYYKMHLVPFGEYTPYKELFFFAGHLLDNVGPFVPGNVRQVFATGGHRYGVFICYESIFGDEMREFSKLGADVLVNISDDGWYGDTSAPWEHLDMVRMRAIENSRWVLRATNTGVTSVIDPNGTITAQLPRHIRGSMAAEFGYRDNLTFYTRHGDWFPWVCAAMSGLALLWAFNRRGEVN